MPPKYMFAKQVFQEMLAALTSAAAIRWRRIARQAVSVFGIRVGRFVPRSGHLRHGSVVAAAGVVYRFGVIVGGARCGQVGKHNRGIA